MPVATIIIPQNHNSYSIIEHAFDSPALAVNDLAAVRGDGIFETLLVQDGVPIKPDQHIARLQRSAQLLELPLPSKETLLEALESTAARFALEHPQEREGNLRLAISRGREHEPHTHAVLMCSPVNPIVAQWRSEGVALVSANRGVSISYAQQAPWSLLGAKTLSYATNMAAGRYAKSQGAEDAIYISSENWVLEGTRGAIVLRNGDTFVTTPWETGILPSTTQAALFSAAEKAGLHTRYELFTTKDIYTAQAAWMVSSVTLATRIHTLDGVATPVPPHEYTQQLWELLGSELHLTAL